MPSYEKNKDSGLWSVRFREIGTDYAYHHKRLSGYRTKRDAQAGYEEYIKTRDATKPVDTPNEMTVAELCERYAQYQKTRVRETTYLTLVSKLRIRIIPFFKKKKISTINPLTIQQWQDSLTDYSYKYRKDLYTMLKGACTYGIDFLGTSDFMRKAKPPRDTELKEPMQIWTPEQVQAVVNAEPNRDIAELIRFLYATGCRKGEALALNWGDIDLENGIVSITKSLTYHTAKDSAWDITLPKNKTSNRKISLPLSVTERLRKFKEEQGVHPFVFGGDRPVPQETLRRHLLLRAKELGYPVIRVHDLRHSHASLLISMGVSVVAVSKRLGHSTVEQTLNTYSHLMPTDDFLIKKCLNETFCT